MKILIIHQYYKTPEEGGAIRSYHIAQFLANRGHDVSVITAYNNTDHGTQMHGKVKVHYLPVYYSNHLSFRSRVLAFWRFMWRSIRLIKKLPKHDLHYVISTPLTTGLVGLFGRIWLNVPYMFEVGDLWPEAPIQLRVIRSSLTKGIARYLEKRIYHKAKHIVALSPDIKEAIAQKTKVPITVITNFSDINFFKPGKKKEADGVFKIGYIGTVGLANNLEYLVNVAESTQQLPIRFTVMGGGAQFKKIQNTASDRGVRNIDFLPPRNKEEVKTIMESLDAVYVSFKKVPVLATGSPNKLFDGLAAGKLIIINFEGWLKTEIEDAKCGFYYDPERPAELIKKLMPYLEDEALLAAAQNNARALAKRKFSMEKQLEKLQGVLHF